MRMPTTMRRRIALGTFAALFVLGTAGKAGADGFISPFLGYNFAGNSGCPAISNCEDKTRNLGVAIGTLGNVVGGEFEFNFIDNFFGETPGASSNVFTMMGNVMFAPKVCAVQPYVVTGLGLMKTNVEFTTAGLLDVGDNNFAWDIGGGVIGFFGSHFGIRGDLRYFHSFQSLSILSFALSDQKIDYGRVSGGVVLKF
jgi:hypothetical protein